MSNIRVQLQGAPFKLSSPLIVGEDHFKKYYYFVLLRSAMVHGTLDWRESDADKRQKRVIICVKEAGQHDYVINHLLDTFRFWTSDSSEVKIEQILTRLFTYFYPSNNEFYEGVILIKEYSIDLLGFIDAKPESFYLFEDVYLRRTQYHDEIIVKKIPVELNPDGCAIYERSRSGDDTKWHPKDISYAQKSLKEIEATFKTKKPDRIIPPELMKRHVRNLYRAESALADFSQELEAVYKLFNV
jgi:hypothetical protein